MSSVRKLALAEAMDKHHCLACDGIIQGLDRYILHKRQDCPALQLVRSASSGVGFPSGTIPNRETPMEERISIPAVKTVVDGLQDTDSLERESTKNNVGTSCGTITHGETPAEERHFSLAVNTDCMQDTDTPEKESTKNSVSTPSGAIPHGETATEVRSFSLAANTTTDCLQGTDNPENESTKNSVRTLCESIPQGETLTEERPSSPAVNAAADCMQDIGSQEMGRKEMAAVGVHVAGTGCLRASSHATSGLPDNLDFQELHHKTPSTRVATDTVAKQCTDTSATEGSLNGDVTTISKSDSQKKGCGEGDSAEPTTMEVPSPSCAVGEPPTSLMAWESSTTDQTSEVTNEILDAIIETKPQADRNNTVKTKKQHWCSVCKRTFLSAAGLSRHFSSRQHKSISSQAPSVSDSSFKSSCTESPGTDGDSSSGSLGVNESETCKANFSVTSADKAPTTRITRDVNKDAFKRRRRVQRKRNHLNNTTGMAEHIEHEDACHKPSKAENGNKDESLEFKDKYAEEQEIQNKGNRSTSISGVKNSDEKLDAITEEVRSTHVCTKGGGRKGRPRQRQKSDSEEKNNSKQHSCSECSFKTTYKASLRRHLEASHKLYFCSSCNQTFVTSEEYSTHQREVHGTSTKRCRTGLECSDCDAQFSTEDDFNVHRREARHMLYMGSMCVFCGKTVSNVTCLRAHIQAVHLGEKPHKCQYCPYSTAWATDLRMHIKRHLGIKSFKCPECDYTAVRMEAVKKHLQTHGDGEPRTLCEICGKSFAGNLQRHMKLHEGLKPFVCTHEGCTYASTYKEGLDVHIRSVHLADKSILCEECGFATTTDKLMKWHKRRKHSGEKPHKCDQCSYATTWRPHLIRHKRTHTGEKPYKCPHCSYSANNVENLRKHILKTKKHQGLQQYICKWCPYTTNSQHDFSHHLRNEHPGEDLGITPTFVLGINRGVVKMRSVRSQDKLGQLAAASLEGVNDNSGSMEALGALPGIVLPHDRLQNDDERK